MQTITKEDIHSTEDKLQEQELETKQQDSDPPSQQEPKKTNKVLLIAIVILVVLLLLGSIIYAKSHFINLNNIDKEIENEIEDKKIPKDDVVTEKEKVKIEILEEDNYYENEIYGYKIEIPAYFEYELEYSGEIVKESNFLQENFCGYNDLVVGERRLRTKIPEEKRNLYPVDYHEIYIDQSSREFAKVGLPIKVEDFRQCRIDRGRFGGLDGAGNPFPPVNSIDDWIEHYEMREDVFVHGTNWECSKDFVAGNTIAVCKRLDFAVYSFLNWEEREYFFMTDKGGFIILSDVVTSFGPSPSELISTYLDLSLYHLVKLDKDMDWIYNQIENIIVSFY